MFGFLVILMVSYTGAQISETRDVSGFTGIAVTGPFIVDVDITGTEGLLLTATFNDTNITDALSTTVEKEMLKVKFLWPYDVDVGAFTGLIHIYITAKSLSKLSLTGSGSVRVNTVLDSPFVGVYMSGSGNMSVPVNTEAMDIVNSGAGYMAVSGTVDRLNVVGSGAGNTNARNLLAETATVTIYGAGNVELNAKTMLSVTQMGSGMVRYGGDPKVNQMQNGAGGMVKSLDNFSV